MAAQARFFSAHEPDVCLSRLRQATGKVDPEAAALGLVDEAGWRPQLKEPKDGGDGPLRLRPPRKLGGVLTLTTLDVRMRRDDAGGTIFEVTRRPPRWPYAVASMPFLLAVGLVILAVTGQWGVLVVAAVALALALALPRLLVAVGDPDVIRLQHWLAAVTDAVIWEDEPAA